uniref:Uncharacterized protein n=1 Tax=Tetranychus urticae TaxID=32264 RepID=T1K5S0_TETUR
MLAQLFTLRIKIYFDFKSNSPFHLQILLLCSYQTNGYINRVCVFIDLISSPCIYTRRKS